jgi:ABC-2 type transport system permease protein
MTGPAIAMNDKTTERLRNPGWQLFRNRLSAQLGFNVLKYEKDFHKRRVKIAITIVIAICLLVFSAYCAAAAYGYAYLGMSALIPGIAMVASSLVTLMFTIFKANGDLFGFRDYEKVMSLPIPIRIVIYSRLGNMYFWNTIIAILVMVPMGIVYGIFQKPGFGTLLMWVGGIFLVSLIPTVLASFIGAVITAIASKFRYASAVSSILGIAFVVGILILSMSMSSTGSGFGQLVDPKTGEMDVAAISALVPVLSDSLNHIYPPAKLFADSIVEGNWLSFLAFVALSIFLYGMFARGLAMKYRQINTALTSHVSRADYKMEKLQQNSMRTALYKKTVFRILKSSVCATNLLIGCIMAVLMAGATVFVGTQKVLDWMDASASMELVQTGACYVLAAIVSMTNTAAVSLALEGKSIWLVKSLPIPPKALYDSYLLTNLTFTLPTSFIAGILLSYGLHAGLLNGLLIVFMPLAFSLFSATFGVMIGNRMAFYDWQDETHLVKQSLMSITGMLGGLVIVFVCGAVALLGLLPMDPKIISFIFIILYLTGAAVIYLRESNRPIKE